VAHESLVQACKTPLMPQVCATDAVEVLSAPDHLASAAVGALGWDGVVLPPMVLLGRRVVVVANLINEVHERRISSGWGPVTDRVSVSTWNWSEMQHLVPPPAVQLSGVIAPARHWRTGLTGAAPFAGLCATALLLPAHIARNVPWPDRGQTPGGDQPMGARTGLRPPAGTPLIASSDQVERSPSGHSDTTPDVRRIQFRRHRAGVHRRERRQVRLAEVLCNNAARRVHVKQATQCRAAVAWIAGRDRMQVGDQARQHKAHRRVVRRRT
jgi:hypothetical protein